MKGISKVSGSPANRKLPVDPHLLLLIKDKLDPSAPQDVLFWACSLTMFFCLLRKSNVMPNSLSSFNPSKHLCRGDFRIQPEGLSHGILLAVRWTKSLQDKHRQLLLPLPFLRNHPLCPVTAITAALSLTPWAPLTAPAFLLPGPNRSYKPILYRGFLAQFRRVLRSLGLDDHVFATHSFRRGGATWALTQGLSADVIRLLGDWKSTAYTAYLELTPLARRQAMEHFIRDLPLS